MFCLLETRLSSTDVKRKGKLRSARIFLRKDARDALDAYLQQVLGQRGNLVLALNRPGPLDYLTRK